MGMMFRTRKAQSSELITVGVVGIIGFVILVSIVGMVGAFEFSQESSDDFSAGTFDGTETADDKVFLEDEAEAGSYSITVDAENIDWESATVDTNITGEGTIDVTYTPDGDSGSAQTFVLEDGENQLDLDVSTESTGTIEFEFER